MSSLIKVIFLISFAAALSGRVLAGDFGFGEDDGTEMLVEPADEYDEDDFQSPSRQWKRGGSFGFWSPHPSDLNPMRRPGSSGQGQRTNRRASGLETPYHPVPRGITVNQKPLGHDDFQTYLDGLRDKRQSPGSFLLMKLGRLNKAAEEQRRLGRRGTLPYSLKTGSVHVKQQG